MKLSGRMFILGGHGSLPAPRQAASHGGRKMTKGDRNSALQVNLCHLRGQNQPDPRPNRPRLAFAIIIPYLYCNAAKQTALPDRGSVIVRASEPPLILTRFGPTASLFTRVVKTNPACWRRISARVKRIY